MALAGIRQGLKGHAGTQCSVADQGDGPAVIAFGPLGPGQAQGSRNGGTAVAGIKDIKFAFGSFGEARKAPLLAQGRKEIPPAGQDLPGIGLVADIKDDRVPGEVSGRKKGDGEFNDPEIGRQMAAGPGHGLNNIVPQFLGQFFFRIK